MNKKGISSIEIIIILIILLPSIMPVIEIFYEMIEEKLEEGNGINDYARITDVYYKAEILDEPQNGGNVLITERLTFDVHAAKKDNLFWELWRDLPEDDVDGLAINHKVKYVKQIKENTEILYKQSPILYWEDEDYTSDELGPGKWFHSTGTYSYNYNMYPYEALFIYVDGLYREKVTFEIQYITQNAILKYNDVSELYLPMYSDSAIKHLNSFKAEILIPNKDMPKKGNYLAHTYGTKNNTFEFKESKTKNTGYHTFYFNLDKDDLKFNPYNQYIEFTLLGYNEDKHAFADYAPNNYYSNTGYLEEALAETEEYDKTPQIYKAKKILFLIISCVVSLITIILTLTKDKRIKNKYQIYKPTTNIHYFREIPSDIDPLFIATIIAQKNNKKIDFGNSYSAIMLSLIRKGYISIEKINNEKEWDKNNIVINILYKPVQTLSTIFTNQQMPNISPRLQQHLTMLQINNLMPESLESYQNTSPEQNNNIQLQNETHNINKKELEPLTKTERLYFNLILENSTFGSSITMQEFQKKIQLNYFRTNTFIESIKSALIDIGINSLYFQKSKYDEVTLNTKKRGKALKIIGIIALLANIITYFTRYDLTFGALFILGITLISCGIYLKKKAKDYLLLTQLGTDEIEKWQGLYNYLNSETLMNEKEIIDLVLWEKYLIYATAFGISDKIVKAIEINCPEIIKTQSVVLKNRYYRSSSFRSYGRSIGRTTRSASSRASSYSSYSGGGRGGGSGGGGH